jgi:nitrogen fixation protein NifU and related proteins
VSEALHNLYQSIIRDHNKQPRNYGKPDACTHFAEGYNPLCGDKVTVFLTMEESQIKQICFESASCAICKASASIMSVLLKDKSQKEAAEVSDRVRELLSMDHDALIDPAINEELAALAGVRKFPTRVKCALLPWETFLNVEHRTSNFEG